MTARSFKNLKGCSIDLAKYLAQKEMMNPNFYRPKNMSRIHPKAYDIVFFFIVLSGLNIEMLNNNFLFEFVTPVRLGWLIILVFLTFTLKFKYIGFSAPFYFWGVDTYTHLQPGIHWRGRECYADPYNSVHFHWDFITFNK